MTDTGSHQEYLLVLGSNHHRAKMLRLAYRRLDAAFELRACSRVARTRDPGGARYLNVALRIAADARVTPDALKQQLRSIEDEAGRVRGSGECVLDIDLLASCRGSRILALYKPDDLRREYVRQLLLGLRVQIV
ncbi:MAG: hypothetical protein E6Q88_03735 [Lysobacteraceae bacterium]|nr:MAG: hypothetical protein E6Q88_03735 [Xanthomonadaceae bacterium]